MFFSKLSIILAIQIVLIGTMLDAQTLSKTSGELSFNELDFPAEILNYPSSINETWRSIFNETKINRMFLHTFQYRISKDCRVAKATLFIKVTNLSTTHNNDELGFVENGKLLYKAPVWLKDETSNTMKMISFDLSNVLKDGSILDSMNDGDFSFYIQDDTSVDSVKLVWTVMGNSCN